MDNGVFFSWLIGHSNFLLFFPLASSLAASIIIVVHRRQQTANRRGLLAGRQAGSRMVRQGKATARRYKLWQSIAEICPVCLRVQRPVWPLSGLYFGLALPVPTRRPIYRLATRSRLVPLRARACSRIRDRSPIEIGRDKTNSKIQRCNEKNPGRLVFQ